MNGNSKEYFSNERDIRTSVDRLQLCQKDTPRETDNEIMARLDCSKTTHDSHSIVVATGERESSLIDSPAFAARIHPREANQFSWRLAIEWVKIRFTYLLILSLKYRQENIDSHSNSKGRRRKKNRSRSPIFSSRRKLPYSLVIYFNDIDQRDLLSFRTYSPTSLARSFVVVVLLPSYNDDYIQSEFFSLSLSFSPAFLFIQSNASLNRQVSMSFSPMPTRFSSSSPFSITRQIKHFLLSRSLPVSLTHSLILYVANTTTTTSVRA